MHFETIAHPTRADMRYTVAYDEGSEDPRGWFTPETAQILTYRSPMYGRENDNARDSATGTMRAFWHVLEEYGDDDKALEVARRYARLFEPRLAVEVSTVRGYSQSDWRDVVAVVESPGYGTPGGHIDTFRQWVFGDVYSVALERGEECGHGDTHWETVDSIGGIYADGADDAVAQYRADFEAVSA